jgi:hypothetical protein
MGSSGNTIRQSLYNLTTTPTVTDDDTLGYSVGSLWTLDDGTVYVCSDATTGAAVWAIGGIPDLQQVTDVNNTTSVGITVDNGTESIGIKHNQIKIVNASGAEAVITSPTLATTTSFEIPNKLGGTETFAMLSDITANPMTTGGDIIYGGVSGVPTRLANGTAGQVLQSNGTTLAPSWAAAGGGGDVYLANDQTFTGENTFAIASGSKEPIIVTKGGAGAAIKVTKSSGSGDAIEVAQGSVSIDDETASTIASFDGSKRIKSLATATYPSLTELSYVKGVTSAIQTQLNALAQTVPISSCSNGTAITGTLLNTFTKALPIPANSRTANQAPQVDVNVEKTGTAGNINVRLYWNTTPDIAGTPIFLGIMTAVAATRTQPMSRILAIEVANGTGNGTKVVFTGTASLTQWASFTSAMSIAAIDWTAAGNIVVAASNGSILDSTVCSMIKLH